MIEKTKFLKLVNPKRGYYSHEDQEVHGLRFRVFYSDDNISLYGISGEEAEIAMYMDRFGADISELTDINIKTEMGNYAPSGERPCLECGGTGTISIPAFDVIKTREEIEKVFVPVTK